MKLSCLPVSLFPQFLGGELDIAAWARIAGEIGFDGFDISCMFYKNHTPSYLGPLGKDIAAAGIPLIMVSSYPDFTNPDPAQRAREEAYLACDIAISAELGAKYVRVLAGQAHPGMGRDDGVRLAVDGLRRSADTAARHGITLVYENHAKPGAWHYIDFSFPRDIFMDVFEKIRDTRIRLNFDIGNATAIADRPGFELEFLKQVMDKVETLHLSDMSTPGAFSPTLIGTGKTPVREIFAFLAERGFDGWLCLEEAGGQGLDGVKKAHDFVRRTWEEAGRG